HVVGPGAADQAAIGLLGAVNRLGQIPEPGGAGLALALDDDGLHHDAAGAVAGKDLALRAGNVGDVPAVGVVGIIADVVGVVAVHALFGVGHGHGAAAVQVSIGGVEHGAANDVVGAVAVLHIGIGLHEVGVVLEVGIVIGVVLVDLDLGHGAVLKD